MNKKPKMEPADMRISAILMTAMKDLIADDAGFAQSLAESYERAYYEKDDELRIPKPWSARSEDERRAWLAVANSQLGIAFARRLARKVFGEDDAAQSSKKEKR
jgi:hypothetical protein